MTSEQLFNNHENGKIRPDVSKRVPRRRRIRRRRELSFTISDQRENGRDTQQDQNLQIKRQRF